VAGGHVVGLSRHDDTFVDLTTRSRLANSFDTDLFISLHFNSVTNPQADGYEVWTSPGQTLSDAFASLLFPCLGSVCPGPGRKDVSDGDVDKESKFSVLIKTWAPAVLVEFGFLSHAETEREFMKIGTAEKLAMGVAHGIVLWMKEGAHHAHS
jgi:N-acetylmuramoyl-L-alanine amidase